MSRAVVVAAVFVAMPFALTVGRSVFAPEAAAAVKEPRELTALTEAEALPRRYGLEVVAMPEPPRGDLRAADPTELVCPDIRAIVSGESPFAIVAWDEVSHVVKPAQTIDGITVRRISSKSITFAKADATLHCKLSVR